MISFPKAEFPTDDSNSAIVGTAPVANLLPITGPVHAAIIVAVGRGVELVAYGLGVIGTIGVIQLHINVAVGMGEVEGDDDGIASLEIHGEPVVVAGADLEIGIGAWGDGNSRAAGVVVLVAVLHTDRGRCWCRSRRCCCSPRRYCCRRCCCCPPRRYCCRRCCCWPPRRYCCRRRNWCPIRRWHSLAPGSPVASFFPIALPTWTHRQRQRTAVNPLLRQRVNGHRYGARSLCARQREGDGSDAPGDYQRRTAGIAG